MVDLESDASPQATQPPAAMEEPAKADWTPLLMPGHWTLVSESATARSRAAAERRASLADFAWYLASLTVLALVTLIPPTVLKAEGRGGPFVVGFPLTQAAMKELSLLDNATSPEHYVALAEIGKVTESLPRFAMSLVALVGAAHLVSSWAVLSTRQVQA
jgi:hypothetical protein